MANLSLTDIAPVLEELYLRENQLEDMVMRDNPLLGMLPKSESGGGAYRAVHCLRTRNQGRSADFSTAQSNIIGTKREQFQVTWTNNYQLAAIDGDVIDDAGGNETIIIDHIQQEMDGAIANLTDDLASNIFRTSGGSRGTISSTTTTTATLTNPEDVANFEVGMEVVADTVDGGGTLHAGSTTITAINRDTGVLTSDATWTTAITGFAANDHLFAQGDYDAKASGLADWIPAAAPGATAFYGVDRSVDPVRLGGVRYTGTGMPLEQAIVQGCARVRRWKKSSKINLAVLNPLQWAKLAISKEARHETVNSRDTKATISYDAIVVATPSGDVPVIADPNCQPDICWLLNTDVWMIESVGGPLVRLLDEDGLPFLRQASADGYELRIKARWNMWTKDPGANARVAI